MKAVNVAVVGVTGMVGRMFLKVLEERDFPVDKFYAFASSRSAGGEIEFKGKKRVVIELTESSFDGQGIDIALFSAGGAVSGRFAPFAAKSGCVVIDNSSHWRMNDDVPLVVPEVNPEDAFLNKGIIANPNCSTIQAVVALKPLHDAYKIKRVVYSTYQAVSGAGMGGLTDLTEGLKGAPPKKFPRPIAGNCLPHIDVFTESGYTKEEIKMIEETRKILHEPALRVTATAVRTPVITGHSESINVEFEKPFELEKVIETLKSAPGVVVKSKSDEYPTPLEIAGSDEVYVGRIRRDESVENGVNLWVVADNLRKGAATNAVQIAQSLLAR
ncbi:MAG: aspartate-semialdehyde dehydrogenase [Clostridiales bacterium]|nr:aspartate-semialdehyde dehydrogenase [Clostridiales bacterium]